ncbi:cholesteryl ester transfer protein isoform X2 [Pezoporus wallicus]|uniref:cholesteryl ester transfer protein isoform X2 n=1 Tax=Pezoporus wallicus TaxID=35540 RepID=UPI002549F958|nr:cholesteryl ester transfer protein isoform X2 [Pezoporus wallicus]XP_061301390.1 cholesteryl ester transfer protein isoform X2 [Pezoporus flaviventris]
MRLGTFRILLVLVHVSAACEFGPFPYSVTGIVCRMTKPAALLLNQETAQVIQAAFRNAKFPNITGERSMRLLGKVAYGLTNIQVNDLSIEQSEVELKENDAIHIAIKNVTAFFKGTLNYGYAGTWFLQLFHSVDFEIESSIDLQINIKLMCQKDQVAADASDCYLTFHKLMLHLQGDKEPGWLKQLFTDFISFTLKFVLKSEVCNEINFLAQVLANFVHDLAENFVRDEGISVDISLASVPLIKANYLESHHKALFEMEDTEARRNVVQMIFQGTSYNDSVARVWSLAHPQISVQPEGTVVKSLVAVEVSTLLMGEESLMVLYMEKEITVTIQAAYAEKKLILHPLDSRVEFKVFNCTADPSENDPSIRNFLQTMISVVGIPEVISRIEPALTSLMNSKGLHLFEIRNPEIITRKGYIIVQLDFSFPNHLLLDFLQNTL